MKQPLQPPRSLACSCSFALLIGLSAFAGAACQGSPLHDLGFRDAALGADLPVPPRPESRSAFDGGWIGEAEDPFASGAAYRFPSGSTQIVLQLAAGAEGGSHITFGAGPGPAPATDPDLGFPLEADFDIESLAATDRSIEPPTEGFAYSLGIRAIEREFDVATGEDRAASLEVEQAFFTEQLILDGRADYDFYPNEVVDSWCALQTPESCPSNQQLSSDQETGTCFLGVDFIPMECKKASMCYRELCGCAADLGCWANDERTASLSLGMEAEGLVGVFSGAVFRNERGYQQPLGVVHFRRASPPVSP